MPEVTYKIAKERKLKRQGVVERTYFCRVEGGPSFWWTAKFSAELLDDPHFDLDAYVKSRSLAFWKKLGLEK